MKFALLDNNGKGAYLRQRLVEAGHEQAGLDAADVAILDCDWPWAHPRPEMIAAAHRAGVKVVLYPHGGMPTVFAYDGIAEPDERVAARLEHGTGSIDMARLFGAEPKLHQHAAGWLFSPTASFSPLDDPGRVLFAPMHPNIEALQRGTQAHDPAPRINQRVYRQLLDGGYDLTVSLVGPAHANGLWRHPRARFVDNPSMGFAASYELVAEADTVVAAGTLGALGVALGKPTVMLGQGDFSDYVGGEYVRAKNAGLYAATARYPLDAEDGELAELLQRACEGSDAVDEWRAAFVGDDGTERAVRLIENLASGLLPEQAKYGDCDHGGPMQKNVTIEGVTARVTTSAG